MNEQTYEYQLNIVTEGNQQGFTDSLHHNRYEPTPYELLDKLFQNYSLSSGDRLVDVGCGKGRLNFYVHHLFGAKSAGIEMNPVFYTEALENKKRYLKKHAAAESSINFYNCLAQEYSIVAQDTIFYFFNPFSVEIFIAFINKILISVETNSRKVEVILFFASQEYSDFLETSTVFQLIKEIQLPDFHKNPRERFLIYRLPKMD
ncbi:SAM-dependent methyltransferase [Planococcus antarcticus DSM 14505]|uniref:SAM-dependent methyltransferase n=1 Tax=Planococcus antarcticus DSM 14505 TaxID=1185653 RepID=A0ABM6D3H4_9BACL|nr:class I SAM-dependent methyltransferase [Planococcus antarcticus]ANU09720.1 SAM-dependent methyltransferase [Planococcus antarcticus DSM 14505]